MAQPNEPERPSDRPNTHSARDARGAEIILRTRTRKIIFFGGLIGFILLIFVLGLVQLAGR